MNKSLPATAKEQLFAASALLMISAILYLGRTLLIPILLAVFLAFVLTPLVIFLQKRGMHRYLAVGIVMTAALTSIGGLGYAVYTQVAALAIELPTKKDHIIEKARYIIGTGPGPLSRLLNLVDDINTRVQDQPKEIPGVPVLNKEKESQEKSSAIPITIQQTNSSLTNLSNLAITLQHILGFVTLTIGLCMTMLLRREDLRNRLISLIGHVHVTSTTKAMEEVNNRISRYLLGQVILNSLFALLFGIGLMFLQVDYALLWSLLAFALRFIPGLGTWMSAMIPIVISLATPGWWQPVTVILLTAVLGILFNYFVEPIIISRRTGISIVSLVIMAAFWTWLWGLPGLVLATPISVCLLVLGSHIPMFHFLYVMLVDGSVLDSDLNFYQRLLADDEDEAMFLLETYLEENSLEDLGAKVIIPTLVNVQKDYSQQQVSKEEMNRILETTNGLLSQILEGTGSDTRKENAPIVLGCPSHDIREEAALRIFGQLLPAETGQLETMSNLSTVVEIIECIREKKPVAAFVVSLSPRGSGQPRLRCKRLRAAFPDLNLIVAVWGLDDSTERDDKVFLDAGATAVTWSLRETLDQVIPLLRVAAQVKDDADTQPGR